MANHKFRMEATSDDEVVQVELDMDTMRITVWITTRLGKHLYKEIDLEEK